MPKVKPTTISRRDAMRIAAEASVDVRTVTSAYAGKELRTLTRERIVEAARKLKIELPPGEK